MKIQLYFILLFVSISVIGIFISQGYWLWNTYEVEKKQMADKVHQLFEQSIAETLVIHLTQMEKDSTQGAPHGEMSMGIAVDSISRMLSLQENKKMVRYYRNMILNPTDERDKPLTFTKDYYKESYDVLRLASSAGMFEMVTAIRPISILTIDSVFGTVLERNGIFQPHFVDAVFGKDTLIDTSKPKDLKLDNLIQSRRVSITMNEDFGLQGFVADANQLIYQRMLYAFMLSVFFVLLTTACYFYLIRTILRQKTIAQIKNDFINNMTHELKTPITITYSAIDALQTFRLADNPVKREEYFTICKQQLKQLTELVEKILSMAIDERKNFHLQKEQFQLEPIVKRLSEQFVLKANKPVRFQIENEWGEQPVYADKFHLTHVIANLIDNAIKYTPVGSIIDIVSYQREDMIVIEVRDNGEGIPDKEKNKIFEKFYTLNNKLVDSKKSIGLGLALCKSIIQAHQGTLTVTDNKPKGTIFTFTLPATKIVLENKDYKIE